MFAQNQLLKAGHFVLSALLAVVVVGLLTTTVRGQDTVLQSTGDSPSGTALPSVIANDDLDELRTQNRVREIQEQTGGSILGPILGSDMDPEERNRVYNETLEQLVREDYENKRRSREIAVVARQFVVDSREKMEAFREVARQLEESAWELEEVGAYDSADSLREQANKLRQQARKFIN